MILLIFDEELLFSISISSLFGQIGHADFVEMKVHGLEARVSKCELTEGTQLKKFLRNPNCPNRITMTRWSLDDEHVSLIDVIHI